MIGVEEQQSDIWAKNRKKYLEDVAKIIDLTTLPDHEILFRITSLTHELINEHPNDDK
jgi:hypothetical protein